MSYEKDTKFLWLSLVAPVQLARRYSAAKPTGVARQAFPAVARQRVFIMTGALVWPKGLEIEIKIGQNYF